MTFDFKKSRRLKLGGTGNGGSGKTCCLILAATALLTAACQDLRNAATTPGTDDDPTPSAPSGNFLYVASGACYGGGVATQLGVQTIARFSLASGLYDRTIADYLNLSGGTTEVPNAIDSFDADRLVVAVETGSTTRRIDLVDRSGTGVQTYFSSTAAFNQVLRAIVKLSDGTFLISKGATPPSGTTGGIEKFTSGKSRLLQGANPWILNPAGSCTGSNVTVSGAISLPQTGKILMAHAGTGAARLALISAAGYAATGDCLAVAASPLATSMPTALLQHPSGDILVAYGNPLSSGNFIYSYRVNETTNTISAGTVAYSNSSVVMGPSAMAVDPSTGDVFVANAASTFNSIEKFTYDSTTQKLTRVGSLPFVQQQLATRCVSGLSVGP
jgi:hypothetical protein